MCVSAKRMAHRDLELWSDQESWMWQAHRCVWAGRWEIQNSHPVEDDRPACKAVCYHGLLYVFLYSQHFQHLFLNVSWGVLAHC